jgi:hypothetical protein
MPFRRGRCLVGFLALAAVFVPARPADAECLYAVVYVTREGDSPVYVVGENDPCLTPTPWYQEITLPSGGHTDGMPTGAPNGYFVDLRVPVP